MKNIKSIILCVMITVMLITPSVPAQTATMDEALIVAENWIERIVLNQENWGCYDWAQVADIQEFKRADRVIGYFCRIEPVGFIIVSLRKELAPVKAYSADCNLDPDCDEGMADLIKMKMEAILDAIEQPIQLQGAGSVQDILEIDYRPAWDELCNEAMLFSDSSGVELAAADSDQVGPLLNTSWHQGDPYNQECPSASGGCTQERCSVGCVALAGAQIMKYWNWPPENFDWLHMANKYIWDQNRWEDENGNRLDNTHIEAVSILCREIGDAVGMQYCLQDCQSSSNVFDMDDTYRNHFFYYVFGVCKRSDNQNIWYDEIQRQLKSNWPIHYDIRVGDDGGHSLVLDGWRENGGSAMLQYHMNYGWGKDCDDTNGCNAWYSLDALYTSNDINEELIIADIFPAVALGDQLAYNWTYRKEQFNYRYFDQDATGESVTFAAGQNLQFLPGVKVECTGGDIEFRGGTFNETQLFSIKGTKKAEVNIHDGAIILYEGGGIRFH